MVMVIIYPLLQALRRFESMSSIKINGAASIADLAVLAVECEQQAGAWRVRSAWFSWQMMLISLQSSLVGTTC